MLIIMRSSKLAVVCVYIRYFEFLFTACEFIFQMANSNNFEVDYSEEVVVLDCVVSLLRIPPNQARMVKKMVLKDIDKGKDKALGKARDSSHLLGLVYQKWPMRESLNRTRMLVA